MIAISATIILRQGRTQETQLAKDLDQVLRESLLFPPVRDVGQNLGVYELADRCLNLALLGLKQIGDVKVVEHHTSHPHPAMGAGRPQCLRIVSL
jgi:hypothetical protein